MAPRWRAPPLVASLLTTAQTTQPRRREQATEPRVAARVHLERGERGLGRGAVPLAPRTRSDPRRSQHHARERYLAIVGCRQSRRPEQGPPATAQGAGRLAPPVARRAREPGGRVARRLDGRRPRPGHVGRLCPVYRVRPVRRSHLVAGTAEHVRVWDVRGAAVRAASEEHLGAGGSPVSVCFWERGLRIPDADTHSDNEGQTKWLGPSRYVWPRLFGALVRRRARRGVRTDPPR